MLAKRIKKENPHSSGLFIVKAMWQCKLRHLVTKFVSNAMGAIW